MTLPGPSGNLRPALWAILALAAGLRLWGIAHSLPFSYYPDEAHFVKRALSMGSGDLNPHWFHKPALYMYALCVQYGALFLVGKVAGLWAGVSDFATRFVIDPGLFYLVGRLTTALFSLGTVWLVYRIGERIFSRGAGIAGALVFAVIPGVIAASQDVKEDIPSMFFSALALLFLLRYLDDRRTSSLVGAAIAAGASAATKAYGLALLGPLVAVIFLGAGRPAIGRGALLGLLAVGLFWVAHFALAPFSFLDPLGREATFGRIGALIHRIFEMAGLTRTPAAPDEFLGRRMGILPGFGDYIRVLASPSGLTWTLALLSLFGTVLLLLRRTLSGFLLIGYTALFVVVSVVVHPGYAEARHQTPVDPALAVCCGVALVWFGRRLPRAATVILIVAALAVPIHAVVWRASEVSKEDTRNVAKRWIESSIPAGTTILADENGPPLLTSERELRRAMREARAGTQSSGMAEHYSTYVEIQMRAARESTAYDLSEIRRAWWRPSEPMAGTKYLDSEYDRDMGNPLRAVGVEPYDRYLERGFQYAVVHSGRYGDFREGSQAAKNWPSFAGFYAELFRRGALVREFTTEGGRYTGPTVRVYRFVR